MGHDHGHGHGHAHAHHHHGQDSRNRVGAAALLTLAFMGIEIVGGILSGSLALLADAAHMLTDAGALGLAWFGFRIAERPADSARSFGFHRVKVLAAFTNGLALVALAAWILWEAIERLMTPSEIIGPLMLSVAVAGLVVNLIAFAILHGGDRHDLNMRGALWHVAGDLLGSVCAIIAACVIMMTGWMAIDSLLSVFVALMVASGGVRLVRDTAHILLEGTPPGLSTEAIAASLVQNVPGVNGAHHLHAWSLNESRVLITLEVDLLAGHCPDSVRRAVKTHLASEFGVNHATVEVHAPDQGIYTVS